MTDEKDEKKETTEKGLTEKESAEKPAPVTSAPTEKTPSAEKTTTVGKAVSPDKTTPTKNPADVDLSKLNALVVEDDAGGMAIIGVMMRYLHIKAYINTTGEGVVPMAKAMRPRPDIVFCDINLPRTTGYEVLKEIRADAELKDTLVIAVTAQDADTEIPKAREAGFDGYIGKPLNRMRFPKQIRRIMAGEEVWETY